MNLTPPWTSDRDAHAPGGQTVGDGSAGPAAGETGGASGADTAGTPDAGSGAPTTDVWSSGGASDGEAAGAGGVGGSAQSDVPAADGSVGATATGGSSAGGGLDSTVATGGSTTSSDAQSPTDQALKNDTANVSEVVPLRDAAVDAPAGTDLSIDSTTMVPTQGLIAYYPCELAHGASLPDMSGKGNDAVLTGAFSFATGQVGKALVLTAVGDGGSSGGYATLPPGILLGATEMTIAAWFTVTSTLSGQRVFDFGTSSTTSSMYFTTQNSAGVPQFTIRLVPDGGTEIRQNVTSKGSSLSVNAWHHVAVVLDATGGHLYLDGVAIGSNTGVTLRPADLGAKPNDWIGRSEFVTDPYFDGMIDELRVYNRGLTASEIAELFTAR